MSQTTAALAAAGYAAGVITAHLAAGYLLTRGFERATGRRLSLWRWGLPLSVWPDLDVAWFLLAPGPQPLHHAYPTHLPVCVLAAASLLPLLRLAGLRAARLRLYGFFLLSWLVHLLLDSVSGTGVRWLYPLHEHFFRLVDIPFSAEPERWLLDCVWHWSFAAEPLIWGLVVLVALRWPRARPPGN